MLKHDFPLGVVIFKEKVLHWATILIYIYPATFSLCLHSMIIVKMLNGHVIFITDILYVIQHVMWHSRDVGRMGETEKDPCGLTWVLS